MSWADRIRRTWRASRWALLVALAFTSFALGYVGWREYFDDAGIAKSNLDVIYLTLQLYTLESGSVAETGAPWSLEIARLAAPAFSAAALMAALAVAFRQQLADWRLRREHGHVVVCGLGAQGTALVAELLTEGRHVVGIDPDGTAPGLDGLRRRGAEIIIGDARERDTLDRARLDRASHLICLAGTDEANAETVLQATALVAERSGPALSCLAHIRDAELCVLMRSEELASAHRTGIRVDFFNLDEQGVRAMIREHSPFPGAAGEQFPPEIVVVGLNQLGQTLVTELARQWRSHPGAEGRSCTIMAVDPDAGSKCDRLRRRSPQLENAARVVAVDAEIDPLDAAVTPTTGPTAAYVCMDDGSAALKSALALRQRLTDPAALVVVDVREATGLGRLVERPAESGRVRVFSLHRAVGSDLLLGGTNEVLAQAIHEEYLDEQRREGATVEANPSLEPWDRLPVSLKESNRDQAAHIGIKLAAIGRGIAPLADWDADKVAFTRAEVEVLAEMEHDRWVHQRLRDGWTAGPKNVAAKRTPYLVPWDELEDRVKEWDRQAVRGIPGFLARAGYQVVGDPRPDDVLL